MPLPRIPTFDELLKRVRQPKVPKLEELDATQASEFGFNLPPNWRLSRLGGVDSLISPRGLTFRDLKRDDNGQITDFQAFRGDRPVRLPQPIVEPPPVDPPPEPPPEPPLVEPPPIKPPTDTGTAQSALEARIGRKLTFGEVLGASPIPELKGQTFSAYTSSFLATGAPLEEIREPMPFTPLWETVKVFGESLVKLPKQVAASVLQATQGESGPSVVDPDWADKLIAEAGIDIDKFTQEVVEKYPDLPFLTEVAQVSRNIAFSITSMGAGLGVGVPTAFIPLPGARVAAWTAGTAASGYVAYQMTTYQIVQQYLELKDAESREQRGRGLTLQEENQLKQEFSTLATKYGLWEAIPEALSNLAFAGLLTAPLTRMVGGSMARSIVAKIVGIYGEELLTETITQKGQSTIEVEAGLREGKIGWIEAFKEIAPQTFLLTTILGGTGAVSVATYNRIKTSLKTEVGEASQVYKDFDRNVDELMQSVTGRQALGAVAEQTLQAGAIEQGGLPQPTVESVVAKIAANQPLTVPERQLYANQSQAVEAALQEQAEVTPAITPPTAPTPTVEPVTPAVPEVTPEVAITQRDKFLQEQALTRNKALIDEEILKAGNREIGMRVAADRLEGQVDPRTGVVNPENIRDANLIREAVPTPPAVEVTKPPVEVTKEVTEPTVAPEVETVEVELRRQLGELSKMADIWSKKLQGREKVKASLAKFVRENLPTNVRGRYITSVARVKTDAQLQKQIDRILVFAELNAQKTLKAEINKEIKKAKATIKDKILKGKFTPDVQRRLDVIARNLNVNRDTAREQMASNIQKADAGEISHEDMLKANESLNFAGIEGMSSEELANTLEYIKILETIGKSERQAKQESTNRRLERTRTDISNILTGGKGLKPGIGAVPRREQAAVSGWLDAFANWQYGIDNIADKLSKFDFSSAPYKSVINELVSETHRATNREVIGRQEAFDSVIKEVGEVFDVKGTHNTNQVLNRLEDEVDLGVFELTGEYKAKHPDATTINIKMTRNELVAKYMQMQDPTLNNTFITGMGWSQKVRDAVVNNLSEQEKKLAESFFEFYEGYYDTINPIYQELYNVDMPHNPNYSPIRRDFEGDVAENILTFQDASQYASVLNGSLKARRKNIRPLKFNGATDILSNHIEQMEHFKAWAFTIRDLRRVFGNTEIRQAIEQYHGTGIIKRIDKFIDNMARGGIETAVTNKTADHLRKAFTQSILPIKPVVGLKQLPSTFAYITGMDTKDFVTGIADFWNSPIANFKFLYNNSEGFRARVKQGNERDIRATLEKHGKAQLSGKRSIRQWLFLNIRIPDSVAVSQGMWAKTRAELKAMGVTRDTATPAQLTKAINAAEDLTGRTQPSFGIDTLSSLQSGGSFMKLLTMFQNQPNKYFRIEADAIRNFKYKRGSRAKAAQTIILVHVILPMLFQYIADAFQFKPDRQARAGILGGLNFILIVGQLIQSAWGWLAGDPFDYQVSPVLSTVDEIQRAVTDAKKIVEKGLDPIEEVTFDDVADLVEHMAKAGGQLTGAPTPYLVQTSKAIRTKVEEDEDIKLEDFLFSQWALEPTDIKAAEKAVEEANTVTKESISNLGEFDQAELDAKLEEAKKAKASPARIREIKAEDYLYDITSVRRDMGNATRDIPEEDILKLDPIAQNYLNLRNQSKEYDLLSDEEQEQYIKDNPSYTTNRLFWGQLTTIPFIDIARALEAQAKKYNISPDMIPAFQLNDSGQERIPSDRNLWDGYFTYYDLPGSGGYLSLSQSAVDDGRLPEEHRQIWEAYQNLRTDIARAAYRKRHRNLTVNLREEFRRANIEFDQWLIDQEYNKPLPKKTIVRTGRAGIAPVETIGFGAARPRQAAPTFPTFPSPRISTGISVKAPTVPGF